VRQHRSRLSPHPLDEALPNPWGAPSCAVANVVAWFPPERRAPNPDRVRPTYPPTAVTPRRVIDDHRPPASSRARRLIGGELERCIYCNGKGIMREGKRYKKLETVQLWYCPACDRVFTPQRAKGKTYPLKVVTESLMHYYRGETRERTAQKIQERFGVTVPTRTLSTWLSQYRDLTPYVRLRDKSTSTYRANRIIRATRLHHQQVYEYRIHLAKLDWALSLPKQQHLAPLRNFLLQMADSCPHQFFQTNARASQGKTTYDLDAVEIKSYRNLACRAACCKRSPSTSSATMRSSALCSPPTR
jgi:hypothetical protein